MSSFHISAHVFVTLSKQRTLKRLTNQFSIHNGGYVYCSISQIERDTASPYEVQCFDFINRESFLKITSYLVKKLMINLIETTIT